ncbi:DUF1631 domain-containing protein [Pseudomonas indica]|uniref:DUF1631 domain-containing protein n=1 Tax=Pseudomonas indica TaxID=137658 RepID=UPI003FD50B72
MLYRLSYRGTTSLPISSLARRYRIPVSEARHFTVPRAPVNPEFSSSYNALQFSARLLYLCEVCARPGHAEREAQPGPSMSSQGTPPETPRTVSILASRVIQPRFSELVQGCRKLAMNHLAEHLDLVFSHAEDTLFDCAEKAENNQVQTLFFDSMRDIRQQWPHIERLYHQSIARRFDEFIEGRTDSEIPVDLDAEQLALVQNDEYEESLQVSNMVSRVKARCAQSLFALDQRLAVLNEGRKLGEDSNPFGPLAIASSLREAMAPCAMHVKIKTILYVLFDRLLMQSLDGLYEALNARLIEAGILPNLKYTAQRSPAPVDKPTKAPDAPSPATTSNASAPPQDLSAPPPSNPGALFGGLTALLDDYRLHKTEAPLLGGTPSIDSFAPPSAKRTYSASELLDALNRLQGQSAEELAQRLREPQKVDRLKAELHQQLESRSDASGQGRMASEQADVIDLVGMLFDFILDDDELGDSYKIALSHLHTPYLKLALQDRSLFTEHSHPARRLLNSLAQAAVIYGGDGEDGELLNKVHWVVERVIQHFEGDLGLFESLLDEFTLFVATLRHRVELRERRAIEAAKGRDKLLDARRQATDVIARSLADQMPPAAIRSFLEQSWTDVLVFIQLRHGEQSSEWRRASEVAEHLIRNGSHENQETVQGIREELRKGLQLLGHHEADISRLLKGLSIDQQPSKTEQHSPVTPAAPIQASSKAAPDVGTGVAAAVDAGTEGIALTGSSRQLADELQRVEFGTWFEFGGEQKRILKLSWFSSTTQNYMFVDHSGQRAAVKSLAQLAGDMESGLVRILPTEPPKPLMDRALNVIYRLLQRLTGRRSDSR